MLHNQEVRTHSPTESEEGIQFLPPGFLHSMVNRVDHHCFFILYYIGVIAHPLRKGVLLLKKSDLPVDATEPSDITLLSSHSRLIYFHRNQTGLLLTSLNHIRFCRRFMVETVPGLKSQLITHTIALTMQNYKIFGSQGQLLPKTLSQPQNFSYLQTTENQTAKPLHQILLQFFIKFFSKTFGQFRNNA